jgi:hypothetical protein
VSKLGGFVPYSVGVDKAERSEAMNNNPTDSERGVAPALDLLVPERSVTTDSVEEALELAVDEFAYDRQEIPFARIFLDNDLSLTIDGEALRLTERAFEDLCKIVKLPLSFAHEIPGDLVVLIVERLKQLHQQTVVVVRHEGTIVGLVDPLRWTKTRALTQRPHFQPVSNLRVLQMIQNFGNLADETLSITLADAGMCAELVRPEISVEPRPGDVTRLGVLITSSETGGPLPSARAYTLRLVCTNGAVAPRQLGAVYFCSDWRVAFESRVEAFELRAAGLSVELPVLERAYAGLARAELSDATVVNLHRQALYIFRSASDPGFLADRALGVSREQRLNIVREARQREAQRRLLGDGQQAALPGPSGLAAWDVFNAITSTARWEPYRRRMALEGVAGDMIGMFAAEAEPALAGLARGERA